MDVSKYHKPMVMVSGGFDPLHIGHLQMFKEAAKHGKLIVALNSDCWLVRKKGYHYQSWEDRASIIRDLQFVADVVEFDDSDSTACDALRTFTPDIFANGGDRGKDNTPEQAVCDELGIRMLWGVGGVDKPNSSSWINRRNVVERKWGRYKTLSEFDGVKVKLLTIDPGKYISYQQHSYRTEYWNVISGNGAFLLDRGVMAVSKGSQHIVYPGDWHGLYNSSDAPIEVVEVQTGNILKESDIVRADIPQELLDIIKSGDFG